MPNANVGVDIDVADLKAANDAVVFCTGATWPRDLKIPNRDADGIHFAMEFLQVRQTFNFAQQPLNLAFNFSSILHPCWTLSFRMAATSTRAERTSLSSEVETLATTALVHLCAMGLSR